MEEVGPVCFLWIPGCPVLVERILTGSGEVLPVFHVEDNATWEGLPGVSFELRKHANAERLVVLHGFCIPEHDDVTKGREHLINVGRLVDSEHEVIREFRHVEGHVGPHNTVVLPFQVPSQRPRRVPEPVDESAGRLSEVEGVHGSASDVDVRGGGDLVVRFDLRVLTVGARVFGADAFVEYGTVVLETDGTDDCVVTGFRDDIFRPKGAVLLVR